MTEYGVSTQHRSLRAIYDKIIVIVDPLFMDVHVDTGDKFHFRQQMLTSTYCVIRTEDANMNQMEMFLS